MTICQMKRNWLGQTMCFHEKIVWTVFFRDSWIFQSPCTKRLSAKKLIQFFEIIDSKTVFEFGEIPNFSRQTEQVANLICMILYFHIKIQKSVFSILKCKILPWFLHENTIYCIFVIWTASLLSQPPKLSNFAKISCLSLKYKEGVKVYVLTIVLFL